MTPLTRTACKKLNRSYGHFSKLSILRYSGDIVIYLCLGICFLTHLAGSVPLVGQLNDGSGNSNNKYLWVRETDNFNPGTADKKGSSGFFGGFLSSLSMIIFSELGDKTFFIAAVMAMKRSRVVVFSGAMTALAFMTIFSALFGYVTSFIPRVYTYYISTALFAIFGIKMLYDGFKMSSDEGAEELEEVQMNIRQREEDEKTPLCDSTPVDDISSVTPSKTYLTFRRFLTSWFSKVYIQALTMTFLAEWGDRSQLATVVLSSRENIFGVCVGGVLGHSLCTGLAVIGGRMIAQKISVKTVTILGGIVFLGFAIVSLFLDPNN